MHLAYQNDENESLKALSGELVACRSGRLQRILPSVPWLWWTASSTGMRLQTNSRNSSVTSLGSCHAHQIASPCIWSESRSPRARRPADAYMKKPIEEYGVN